MGLKILPTPLKKSLSTVDNVFKEIFPELDSAYRNMMKVGKSSSLSVSNPVYKTISPTDLQQEIKMKNLTVDKFIKSKLP